MRPRLKGISEAYSNDQAWVEGAFCTAESVLVDFFGMKSIARHEQVPVDLRWPIDMSHCLARACSCDRAVVALLLCVGVLLAPARAAAEVHFGNNVFIGGHNFSHQNYNSQHRLHVTLYDRPIRGAGCVTRGDGRGGSVRRCRLQRVPH